MGSSTRPTCTDGKLSVHRRTIGSVSALDGFSPATRDWFRGAFAAPTAAQEGAWAAAQAGRHALVVAPTGSGKTLAAFLWALDRLAADERPADPRHRCRVLYVSPLKALAVDVQRNLRAPLTGIRQAAQRAGVPPPDITVGMRTGDTPADERRLFARMPPDVLVTTPESLFLLLTSAARESLRGVRTVILDEVHAVAGTKRGAHLALSLERLDALLAVPAGQPHPGPAQRIGLSATVRPLDEVATFLAGTRPVEVVQPPIPKTIEVAVEVPVPDLAALDERPAPGSSDEEVIGSAAGTAQRPSIWPAVERRLLDLVRQHRSTIVFANSRRLAERLTARLNELARRSPTPPKRSTRPSISTPSRATAERASSTSRPRPSGQSGIGGGAPPVVAKAHHGSMAREQRTIVEEELKAGLLPCVVATSSLELGIDMGAVDLVVQVEAPPSVASGLQRVGRAGHQVGAVSRGIVFPKYRGDLVSCAVVAERMTSGGIESTRYPRNPLDVLAQHVVAMVALDPWTVGDLAAVVRRAAPFAALPDTALHAVLDMLSGRYPSRGVRRAAGADHLGPGDGRTARSPGRAAAGGHLRRHDPGPRPVHRHHPWRSGRPRVAGRRAGRGDGLRVAGRRHVPARYLELAGRGHHTRPGDRHSRARRAGPHAVLEGRVDRAAAGAGPGSRGVRP